MSDERENLTWELYGQAIRELATTVAEDNFRPDIILGIARGGLIPAGSIGYALSVKNTYVMNVEYYVGVEERLDVPVILPPYLELVGLEDKRFLIVDDVADTGHTLNTVREFVSGKVAEARCAVIYEKPISEVKCEYVWRRTDKWINFPWSFEGPVAGIEAV